MPVLAVDAPRGEGCCFLNIWQLVYPNTQRRGLFLLTEEKCYYSPVTTWSLAAHVISLSSDYIIFLLSVAYNIMVRVVFPGF